MRADEVENAPILGASSSVVSHRAFQGLTRTAAEDSALFLCRKIKQGQKKGDTTNEETVNGCRDWSYGRMYGYNGQQGLFR